MQNASLRPQGPEEQPAGPRQRLERDVVGGHALHLPADFHLSCLFENFRLEESPSSSYLSSLFPANVSSQNISHDIVLEIFWKSLLNTVIFRQ